MAKFNLGDMAATADLFGELKNNGTTPRAFNELFNIPEEKKKSENYIDINLLVPYSEHYFKLPEGEEWESFVASIEEHGVLVPILVREISDGKYQILAGHCRTQAAKEAGIDKIPARIIEADDVAASVIVGVTNKQREYISPIEWGRTYRRTYELMKQQGERTDLTSCHSGTKSEGKRTDELLSEMYGESARSIHRRMRLTYLIPQLYDLFDKKNITQQIAIDLSYLSEEEQEYVFAVINNEKIKITPEQAHDLKNASASAAHASGLTVDDVFNILKTETIQESSEPKPKKYSVPDDYFPKKVTTKKRNDYIIAALKYIRENEIEIEVENEK